MPSLPVWGPVNSLVLLLGGTVSCVRSKPALCTAGSPPSLCLVPLSAGMFVTLLSQAWSHKSQTLSRARLTSGCVSARYFVFLSLLGAGHMCLSHMRQDTFVWLLTCLTSSLPVYDRVPSEKLKVCPSCLRGKPLPAALRELRPLACLFSLACPHCLQWAVSGTKIHWAGAWACGLTSSSASLC